MFKNRAFPHTYIIIFSVIIIAAMATWFLPSGQFKRELNKETNKTVIVPGSYQQVDQQPQTWQIFSSFYKGFVRSPSIIVFILILGGAFWIMNESKAIDAGILSFIRHSSTLEKFGLIRKLGIDNIIIAAIMLMFSFFGAVFGMSEETIAFVIIFVPLAISMGYDSIVGVCMCFIGAGMGFAGCMLNPFTLGIAQQISGVPMFSGIEYRFVLWVIINIVGIGYVLFYANKVKKNPKKSVVHEEDGYWRKHISENQSVTIQKSTQKAWITYALLSCVFLFYTVSALITYYKLDAYDATAYKSMLFLSISSVLFLLFGYITLRKGTQYYILNILFFTILFLVGGVVVYKWELLEIASLFFVMGIVSGISMDKRPNEIVKLFITGAKDILSAALVVGLAGGIIVILEDGKVIDTILYGVGNSISGFGKVTTLSLMYGFQSFLNMIITSGTAKAALIMPILSDISDMVGLSRQATVTAFHIGDGFTNLITPTSGVLIGVLEIARIPFGKWFKWALPFILIMVILGWLLLIPTVTMNLPAY
jgi:uncharacterized ion transporter superfamily protein YfcC